MSKAGPFVMTIGELHFGPVSPGNQSSAALGRCGDKKTIEEPKGRPSHQDGLLLYHSK